MKKIILIGAVIIVILTILEMITSFTYNERLNPPQIVTNFVDLNKVRRISKFRSCSGHTTVPQNGKEMKRSMKHYFTLYPEHHKENFVEIYSPYDGYVALLFGQEEIWIAPEQISVLNLLPINQWMFSVTHVRPREGLKLGNKVRAGELIGYGTFLMNEQGSPGFDVTYGKMSIPPKKIDNWPSPYGDLDSIFNHISTEVLANYEQKGFIRHNLIISKEERDREPCTYRGSGPYFENEGSDDWVETKQ